MIKFVLEKDHTILRDNGDTLMVLPKDTIVEFIPAAYLRNVKCLPPLKGRNKSKQKQNESMTLIANFVSSNNSHKFVDGTICNDASVACDANILFLDRVDYYDLPEFCAYYGIVRKEITVNAYCLECDCEHEF
jgi:hypothetical protein